MPVKAFYDSILEEEGELAAVDILSKSIVTEATMLRLEEQLKRRGESQKGDDKLSEILRQIKQEDQNNLCFR